MNAVDRLMASEAAFVHDEAADALFADAMRENFTRHYQQCPDYARWCGLHGVRPSDINGYDDVFRIPHVFVANFKRRTFITGAPEKIKLTLTSSGTAGEKSAIHLDAVTLRRIKQIVRHIYAAYGMVDNEPTNYVCFTYDPKVASDVGTAWSDKLLTSLTGRGKIFYALRWVDSVKNFQFDEDGCHKALDRFQREGRPVRLLGFPAIIWEMLSDRRRTYQMHPNSYVIIGGGWKTKADREIPKQRFRDEVGRWLGIEPTRVRDLYGMVEHGVPYCECEHGHMHVPIYSRVVARDPATLQALPEGETGLLHMYTPYLNSFPALSLLTSDRGSLDHACPCGRPAPRLHLLGRAGTTRQRSCAVAALDVIGAA
jgi:phenylacetate-coenzyme A ligase PaaK-like adenylate-forming protein